MFFSMPGAPSSVLVTTSKAPVTSGVALVTNSFLLLLVRHLLLEAMHLLLMASLSLVSLRFNYDRKGEMQLNDKGVAALMNESGGDLDPWMTL